MSATAEDVQAEIAASLRVFHAPGEPFEVRVPKTRQKTLSGYFNDPDQAAAAILAAAQAQRRSVYHTLNPIPPDLLARARHKLKPYAETTTKDHEVTRRRWLPIDCDPVRPAEISASAAEHAAALARRDAIVAWLTDTHGWPAPVVADSGNGGHACYAIDLPNDAEAEAIIARVLAALAARFDDAAVTVDPTLKNASRILKVYGTVSRKGDHTPERPHRRARLQGVPEPLVPVGSAQLAAVAAEAPADASRPRKGHGTAPGADVPLLAACEVRGWYRGTLGGGKHAIRCPWADQHSSDSGPSETVVWIDHTGAPTGFRCQHAHCAHRTLDEVLDALELPRRAARGPAAPPAPLTFTTLGALLDEPEEHVEWLVEGRIPGGSVVLVPGKPKAGKSTAARDLAFAAATGGRWLGHRCRPCTVWYLALEESRGEVRRHFRLMGATGAEPIRLFIDQAPADVVAQLAHLAERERPGLIIIDTLQRFIRAKDLSDYAEVTLKLDPVLKIARETGAALVLLHHAGKGTGRDGIDSVLGSTALAGSVDNLIFINRTDRYRTVSTIQRIGDDLPETVILLDEDSGRVTLGGTRQDADVEHVVEQMREALDAADGPLTRADLDAAVEGRNDLRRKAIKLLVSRGHATQVGRGTRNDPHRYVACPRVPYKSGDTNLSLPGSEDSRGNTGDVACPRVPARNRVPENDPDNEWGGADE